MIFPLRRYFLLLLIFILCLLFSSVSYAAGLVPCDGADCTWCSLIQMIQNLINYAIYLGVMASAIMFAYTGFLFLTDGGNSEKVSQAKSMFRNVVIGIVCILAGWLLIDTLMKALTGGKIGPWNQIQCSVEQRYDNNVRVPTGGSVKTNSTPRGYSDINR